MDSSSKFKYTDLVNDLLSDCIVRFNLELSDDYIMMLQMVLVRSSKVDGVETLLRRMYEHQEYLLLHSTDVAILATLVGYEFGITGDDLVVLCTSGLLHDVGKLDIPREILCKTSKLSTDEYSRIKGHPVHGYVILQDYPYICSTVRDAVIQHHEVIDGSGYPYGLKGVQIGLYGHIVRVSDCLDAMVTSRGYNSPLPVRDAISRLTLSGCSITSRICSILDSKIEKTI